MDKPVFESVTDSDVYYRVGRQLDNFPIAGCCLTFGSSVGRISCQTETDPGYDWASGLQMIRTVGQIATNQRKAALQIQRNRRGVMAVPAPCSVIDKVSEISAGALQARIKRDSALQTTQMKQPLRKSEVSRETKAGESMLLLATRGDSHYSKKLQWIPIVMDLLS